jgi:predicted MPP superfamily phosphohydrolase
MSKGREFLLEMSTNAEREQQVSPHAGILARHRGWTLVLNPDGTTTAWNKDKSTILHSHGPPARPG